MPTPTLSICEEKKHARNVSIPILLVISIFLAGQKLSSLKILLKATGAYDQIIYKVLFYKI